MKKLFICIASLFFFLSASGQDLHQTFKLAGHLQESEEYQKAILAYERVLFFDEGKEYDFHAYHQIAVCYAFLENKVKALDYFDRAYYSADNDSLKIEVTLQKVACLLSDAQNEQALMELLSVPADLAVLYGSRYHFYLGIAYFKLGKFKESREQIILCINADQTGSMQQINSVYTNAEKVRKLNPKTAKILSTILPGSGQIYAGDLRNGANSLLLLSAIAMVAGNIALNYSVLDAVMSVMPWYQRYYIGGYNLAEQITIDRKKMKLDKLGDELIEILMEAKVGKAGSGEVSAAN